VGTMAAVYGPAAADSGGESPEVIYRVVPLR